MKPWPANPSVYEINTLVWLCELSSKVGRPITLDNVPSEEWDFCASVGFDAVWLMGVWERSPLGTTIANRNKSLMEDFRRALPDFRIEDNVGSPYCVRNYQVDEHLGGRKGLAVARQELSRRGINLILDFVPNHVAPDHRWVREHPEFFVQGSTENAQRDPASFLDIGGKVIACGRDPFFPAWPDVLQLNAFNLDLRKAIIATLADLADQCDGVRCDMAMLFINSIFARTWGKRAGQHPATEYWVDVISATKKKRADFLFMAEAYWDLEWELQKQGFNYCYDKRLYDRLEHNGAEEVRLHLCADMAYQQKLVRFIENHDEPRAMAAFSLHKQRAAALTVSTIPGARLFHEGQFDGRKVRLPVFLGRRPSEPCVPELQSFYKTLIKTLSRPEIKNGHWQLCERSGWPDNSSFRNIVAWCWQAGSEQSLIIVNLSGSHAQAMVRAPWKDLAGRKWKMIDALSGQSYVRNGNDLVNQGLYVDLAPWASHLMINWQPE